MRVGIQGAPGQLQFGHQEEFLYGKGAQASFSKLDILRGSEFQEDPFIDFYCAKNEQNPAFIWADLRYKGLYEL